MENGSRFVGPCDSVFDVCPATGRGGQPANAAEWIVYDALYEYCREMVKRGKPAGQFAN
jgi:hypothetical protein